ncbi:MAG TPA: sigma 54-interacting transcriptional regulator [Kofleriaceae bacterium]|nr:sigma 54-interacting transcriptional regulator [Kofleriaceae bacterium]
MSTIETLDSRFARDSSSDRRRDRVATETPRLVVVLECRRPTALGCRLMLDGLDEVIVARHTSGSGPTAEPLGSMTRGRRIERNMRCATVFVGDFQVSRQHLAIRRVAAGWQLVDLGSKNGTAVNGRRVDTAMLADGDIIEAGGAMLMFLVGDPGRGEALDRELAPQPGPEPLRTLSLDLERRIQQITKIAPADVPVLLRGETGTGKELMARAIHDISGRQGPFVPINCGALPRDLIESELFGHRRGAFSGANEDREGLIRHAHQGTLFLDEIAELPPDSQIALLRFLQEGEVRPVGATHSVKVDVRVVAATHQDVKQRLVDGRFRSDLYGRLSGFELTLPPLRDRREDLGLLIASILTRVCPDPSQISLNKPVARALFRYPWPQNIRELENALRAAVGLSDGGELRLEHLSRALREPEPPPGGPLLTTKDRALREQLIELLRDSGGNVSAVARAMQRAPVQIRRWCNRLQIDVTDFRH